MLIDIVIILLALIIFWQYNKKPENYPPGPWGIPIFGYLPGLQNFSGSLCDLQKKHGGIFSWRISTKLVVFLCDYQLIKEALMNMDFADRPEIKMFTHLHGEKLGGILPTNGPLWQYNRRFILRHLRELGMGKSKILSAIHYEGEEFVKELKKQAGKCASIPIALTIATLNITWQLIASKRYEFNDENALRLVNLTYRKHYYGTRHFLIDLFSWARKVLPSFMLNAFVKEHLQDELSKELRKTFEEFISGHLETLDRSSPKDFIDVYLTEMEKQKSNPESTMSIEDLQYCMSDMYEAGTETTNSTIHWIILYLAKYSEIQQRLHDEIEENLPKGALVTLEDRAALPYTEAFIAEALRFSSITPNGGPHAASKNVPLGGYLIPKDAVVLTSIEAVHFDSKYYDSPYEFRPERFLDSKGKFVSPKEGFIPFGIGRRVCIGESIARMQILVFLTKLVQSLSFSNPLGKDAVWEGINNPIIRPPNSSSKVIITVRENEGENSKM